MGQGRCLVLLELGIGTVAEIHETWQALGVCVCVCVCTCIYICVCVLCICICVCACVSVCP